MYTVIKRLFDICASGIALIVLLPIGLVVIIGIELSDPGPVFYMAKRVGKNNHVFRMFKFRSMRVEKNADEKSFKADANRIFPFGGFLRKSKIDELPQLINVFMGQMSIVGPRPASCDQVKITRRGRYERVSSIKPGLTSTSSLYDYIYGDSIKDEREYRMKVLPTRLELDLYYMDHMSMHYDLLLILDTVVCIFASIAGVKLTRLLKKLDTLAQEHLLIDNYLPDRH